MPRDVPSEEYKRMKLAEILGILPDQVGKMPVMGKVGLEAARYATRIMQTRYSDIESLERDLSELSSMVSFYAWWD